MLSEWVLKKGRCVVGLNSHVDSQSGLMCPFYYRLDAARTKITKSGVEVINDKPDHPQDIYPKSLAFDPYNAALVRHDTNGTASRVVLSRVF